MDSILDTLKGAALTAVTGAALSPFEEQIKTSLDNSIKKISNHIYNSCKEKKYLKEIQKDEFLRDYIIRSYYDVGKARTLLYKDKRQHVEKFCVFPNLSYKNNGNQKCVIKTDKIDNILNYSKNSIITGVGGTGKTILMKLLHVNCIKQLELIPVSIVLRNIKTHDNYKKEFDIFECIKDSLTKYGAEMSDDLLEMSLKKGCYLILFDGFDEVRSEISDNVADAILRFTEKYNTNRYIISSRPSIDFTSWFNYDELHIEPLNKKQALQMIGMLEYDESIKNSFVEKLDKSFFIEYTSFANNPLLLTLMLLVYSQNSYLPNDFCAFYGEAFRVLYHGHDATKNYRREIHSGLDEVELETFFACFCCCSYFEQKYSFGENELLNYIALSAELTELDISYDNIIKDLCENLSMLIKDGIEYTFVHRSFQEYFAAIYTTKLSDDIQKQLIKKHFDEIRVGISEYDVILYKLNKERFYRNAVVEMINDIKQIYDYCKYRENAKYGDYEFLLELLKGMYYYKEKDNNKKRAYYYKSQYSDFMITLSRVYVIMSIYDESLNNNISYKELLAVRQSVAFCQEIDNILNNYYVEIKAIIDEEVEISAATLLERMCKNAHKKSEVMSSFAPLIEKIKSWFQERAFQKKAIDLLLKNKH